MENSRKKERTRVDVGALDKGIADGWHLVVIDNSAVLAANGDICGGNAEVARSQLIEPIQKETVLFDK